MGKKFLLWICLFLQFNSSIQAQMRRIIRPTHPQHSATIVQSATITNNLLTCSADTILLTTQAQINNFSANYPTCTTPKYLIIDGAGASPAITNLNGLSSLTAIQNKLVIKNTSITTLSSINNITSITDTLQIDNNPNLAALGLTNLTNFGTLILNNLPALTSVAGFSTNLNKIGSINIDSTGITSLAGFSNIDSLTTPFETFSITYTPITTLNTWTDLKKVNGYMWLENLNALTSIGISNLQQCWGFLFSNLPTLTNLGNISYQLSDQNTGTFWFINTGLTTLAGMDSIKAAANFYVSGNNNLTTLQGLQNIAGNVGGISIYGNPLLTSIAPLSNITSANNDATIEVSYNNALTSLNGLQNITNIGKGLWIAGNDNLTNLNALNNNLIIQNNPDTYNGNRDSVRIYDNIQLAICSDTSICNYLSSGGKAFIDNNAAGCNTISEIQASCGAVTINCNDIEPNDNDANAIPLPQNITKCGHVGYQTGVDGNGDPVYDEFDVYKIVMPYYGSINVDFTAKNDSSCFNNNNTNLDLTVLDANFNTRHGESLFQWNNTDTCNFEKTKSIKLRGYAGEEFYLMLNGSAITYTLNWHASDQTTSEPEYNGDFANAIYLNPTDTVSGLINYISATQYDNADFYKTKMPVTGNIRVHVKVKNRQNYDPGVPNGIRFTWKFDNFNSSVFYLPTGNEDDSASQDIDICGIKNDTVYFKIEQQSEANEYQWSYKIIDTLNVVDNYEPNNTLATGTQIAENEIKTATINFMGNVLDLYDSYKTKIPKGGSIRFKVTATDTKCNHGNFIVKAYNINNNQIFGKTFTSTGAQGAVTTFIDSANICGINANDSIFFQITSTDPFSYNFSYKMVDTIENIIDIEPNNSFATATQLNLGDSVKGRINYPTSSSDVNDYYKTVMPYSGNVKIYVETKNIDCFSGAAVLWVYDRRRDNAPSTFFPINNIPSQQTRRDTFNVCGLAADTLYFLINSVNFNTKIQYKIRYEITDTTTSDVEDNGSFNSATAINVQQQKSGTIRYSNGAGTDTYDYYKTMLPYDGTLKIIVQATNMSCANGQYFYLRGYDKRQGGGEILSKYIGNNSSISAGQTVYDTILICGRAADSFYLRFEASNAFKYQWSYVMLDTSANDVEPNNNFATALAIAELQTKVGHIKYASNGGADDLDYYKTLLPKDGTLKILVQATNMSCANGQYLYLRGYDKRQGGGEFLSKYLGNNSSISAGQTVYDTIFICGRAADSFYLRFEASNAAFKYQWSYAMVDTSVNDVEPNNSFATAIGVGSSQTKNGHIKYFANGAADDLDYYKFVFTTSDSLKLQLQATNTSCSNNQWIYLRVYNKNFSQLFEKYFALTSSVAAGQTVLDSIKMYVTAPDTIYLRYEASNPFKYQLSSNPRTPASSFSIIGDTTTCFGVKTYKAVNIFDDNVVYHWALSGGGTLNFTDSIATVNWTTNGTHNLSLYLSNSFGNSATKQKTIVVNNNAPTEVPLLINTARTLYTFGVPSGAVCNWYKSGVLIAGVTDSIYYAQDSGTYTVRFVRPCGTGVASNSFYFLLPALAQTISFLHTPNITMSPIAKAKLNATASSSLPVSYQLISGNATIVNDTVYVTSVGTVIVKAIQQGSDVYAPAPPKYDTITVVQGPQNITFNTIAAQIYASTPLSLIATASSGLPVSYTIVSGNATISGSNLIMLGAGNVTVQANQVGNANYSAATAVQQTFCIGVRTLTSISGSVSPCLNNYVYTTDKIPGANYIWSLSSGGILTTHNDTAFINWTTTGTHTITVKANSNCDAVYSNTASLTITTANNAPTAVTNMLPANNVINQQLPLTLSWLPGSFTVNYDLYVWDSAQVQPATPFASNINTVSFVLPLNSLTYNKTYKWRLVSKNPCITTAGPIQHFRLIPLPDLQVENVQAPLTAFTGQNITINWTVKNIGPGITNTNQGWVDAVYLSYDSINPFVVPANTTAVAWSVSSRTLLIGTKQNLTALDSGQQYTNTLTYTLPLNTALPTYVYVITNQSNSILEVTKVNDTIRAPQPIAITISPAPDLRVDTVFASNTTFSGSTVNVTYKVKNYGANTPAGSFWEDKFYISNSALFNINNATELKAPKANGTFYYNAPESKIINSGIVQADSFYTKSQQIVIPNFLNGTYFIHVITNSSNTIYEGAAIANNIGNKQIQVIITPTPKLQVGNMNTTADTLSNTQPFNINYTIVNSGFYDNIEKNQGHFAVLNGPCTYCPPISSNCSGCVVLCYPSISLRDSLGFGSSAWSNNIYLSTDSTGLNLANATLLSALPQFYNNDKGNETPLTLGCQSNASINPIQVSRNIASSLSPNKVFPNATPTAIPASLPAGKYYIYIWANSDKGVFEYPNTNEIKRSTLPIVIQNADLTVSAISAPTTAYGGQNITINYTVANLNNSGVFNAFRRDYLYISNSPVFDNTATLLPNNNFFFENVLINNPVTHSFNYTFPNNTIGVKYFYVRTNGGDIIMETSYANNVNAAAVSVTTPPASATCDLQVSNINMADTVFARLPIQIQYTVPNSGLGTTQGTWVDSIFVSCTPVFNPATAKYIALRQQTRTVPGGSSYTDIFNFTTDFANIINPCFPVQQFNNAYFFVKTNADNVVYEGANTNNNVLGTGLKVLVNPWPDYVVTQVNSTLDTTTVGRPFPATWTVKNLKYDYTTNQFYDALYFSPDSIFNNNAVRTNEDKYQSRFLLQNTSYSDNYNFTTPNIPTGDYYVFVKTNYSNNIYNENAANNTNLIRNVNGTAKKIHVIQLPLPDFTDSITEAPNTIVIGQPLKVKARITNNGLGANYPNSFSNRVWLNTSFAPGGYDLGANNKNILLNANQFYDDSINIIFPLTIPAGNYILVWHTNNTNAVYETNSNNNLAFKYITVIHPTAVDLMVDNIQSPDTAILGYPIPNFKWAILNNAINSVTGFSSDGVYLSKSNVLDSTASLLGLNQRFLQMNPLQKDTITKNVVVNNVKEGEYNLLVKTDVLNNIVETDKTNNVRLATNKLFVKVVELPLNILKSDSLSNIVYRYYKLKIPDSLIGSTIQVTLKTNDSLTRTNQMYIGANYVPDPAHFDYKYETPNYGNQRIVMTSVNDSLYYITVRNVNAATLQNITLKAVKLPFTILSVQNNSGGNTGNVTVKISGNLFNNTMVAKLKLAATTITASTIYFINSTTVYATFNLAGKPLGIYDVELFKTTDSTYATLANAFSIVAANNGGLITGGGVNGIPGNGNEPGCDPNAASGLNAQLVTLIDMPQTFFIPFNFEFKVNFTNPTNVDIPAQTRVLYADQGTVLAPSIAGLANASSSLHITITEPAGPPGIIRAGASGTLTFYAKAPNNMPGHTFVNITIK